MAKDFDSLLQELGGYGRYQKQLMCLVIVPTSFFIAMQVSSIVFQTVVPDHYCDVTGRQNTSNSQEEWRNLTIPWDEESKDFSSCEQYIILWSDDGRPYRGNGTKGCDAYVYDRSLMSETVATTSDWVCEDKDHSVHVLSIGIVGSALSTFVLPILADKYTGRRPMFFIAITIHAVFNFLLIFIHNFNLHLLLRFLAEWSFQANYQMSYLIAMEFLSPEYRNTAAFLSFMSWAMGACTISFFSWLISDWRFILALTIALDALMWLLWMFLPESPRWLIAKNKVEEAADILLKVSNINGIESKYTKATMIKLLKSFDNPLEKEVAWATLLKYPRYCMRGFMLFLTAGAIYLAYGIVLLNIDVLPNQYFMNFFILSLIEIPSNMCSSVSVQYLGRRFSSILCFTLCAIASFAAALLVEHKIALLVLVAVLRWFLTMGIYIIFLQVVEISPTALRSTGMGTMAVFGAAAMATVPYIINYSMDSALNYWLIMGVSIFCAVCSLPIPETLGLPLPQTLCEANRLGMNRPLTKWIHNWNQKQYLDTKLKEADSANDEEAESKMINQEISATNF